MFVDEQSERELGNWDRVKGLTRKIRRQIQWEKQQSRIKHLEEELWFDVKKAKTGFVPDHSKLAGEDGKVLTSDKRPDRLADYFEKVQWAINDERDKEVKTNKLFREGANTNEGRITLEELRITVMKFKTLSRQDQMA